MDFTLKVEFRCDGRWQTSGSLSVRAGEYSHYDFPQAFRAHGTCLTADANCTAAAEFCYM